VYFDFPLAIAVLHNAGAALLVVLVTMLNYQTKTRSKASAQARPE
jgi:cytochrome c oxidase assembly protein subunit 15